MKMLEVLLNLFENVLHSQEHDPKTFLEVDHNLNIRVRF